MCEDPLPAYNFMMSWQAGKGSGLQSDYAAARTRRRAFIVLCLTLLDVFLYTLRVHWEVLSKLLIWPWYVRYVEPDMGGITHTYFNTDAYNANSITCYSH